MHRFLGSFLLVLALVLIASPALANAPAPWWACEGKAAGDTCDLYPSGKGLCGVQANCTDDPSTTVDECLFCESDPDKGCQSAGGPGVGLALLALAGLAIGWRRRSGANARS